jgi:hypothetical protein
MKLTTWHQNNPKDQVRAILWALEGHISNAVDGIVPPEQLWAKTAPLIDELRKLSEFMKPEWE